MRPVTSNAAAARAATLCAMMFGIAGPGQAAYPERPLRLIVAQSPGGNADIIGRALAEGLSEKMQGSRIAAEVIDGDVGQLICPRHIEARIVHSASA